MVISVDVNNILVFDAVGRMVSAYVHGHNFFRSQDNRVLEKWAAGHGLHQRQRRWLTADQRDALYGEIQGIVADLALALQSGTARLSGGDEAVWMRIHGLLTAIQRYDAVGLAEDGRRFLTIYKPISILPPDQYLALVLQATEGCPYNKCTFCNFYKDRRFRIKSPTEFRHHIAAVKHFLGPAIGLRRSIFLADANAIIAPQERLLDLIDIVAKEFDILPRGLTRQEEERWKAAHPVHFRGIYSFADSFAGRLKSSFDFRVLASRGIRRLYIGLESGDNALLQFLRKAGMAEEAIMAVENIKNGGINVGVIVMLGIGGQRFAAAHVARTIEALNAMNLGVGDIIYFSPFYDFPGSDYSKLASELGVRPLSVTEMERQMAAIREGLRFRNGEQRPQIAIYDIREFVY